MKSIKTTLVILTLTIFEAGFVREKQDGGQPLQSLEYYNNGWLNSRNVGSI